MIRLPKWVIPHKFPAMFDTDSATAIEMTAKLYGAMNSLIEEYNKFIENVETIINGYGDTVLEEGINKNEVFRVAIRQEFQDFMDAVETHLDVQNKNVEEYASKVANNDQLFEQFTTALLNDIREVEERVTSIEENGVDNTTQPDLAENDTNSSSYVQNRTHWKETKEIVTNIMPEKTVTNKAVGYGANADVMLATGTTYRVIWNNVNYDCVCRYVSGFYVLGGEGEPFTLKQEGGRAWVDIFPTVEEFPFTVSIELVNGVEEVYHHLNPKFIKDMYYEEEGIVEVIPETVAEVYEGAAELVASNNIEAGNTCVVKWKNTEYECVVQDLSEMQEGVVGFGDLTTFGMNGNGEPFAFVFNYPSCMVMVLDESTNPTVSVYYNGIVVHKIKDKYLPNNINSALVVTVEEMNNDTMIASHSGLAICGEYIFNKAIFFKHGGLLIPIENTNVDNGSAEFSRVTVNVDDNVLNYYHVKVCSDKSVITRTSHIPLPTT